MIKNYFKIAWRNLLQSKVLSTINLLGLSIGVAAVLMISLYLNNQYGYDDFHENESNLYRVGFDLWDNGKSLGTHEQFISDFGPDAKNELPEVESFLRLSYEREAYVSSGDKTVKLESIRHADSVFFEFFSFKLLQGNLKTVLKEPYSVVLTETGATKLFGSQNALGKTIKIDDQAEFLVTGIAQDPPVNSHINYEALLSFNTLYVEPGNYMGWNGGNQYITYLSLKKGIKPQVLQNKLVDFMWEHTNKEDSEIGIKTDAYLQPIKDIHLYHAENSTTLRTNIYVFSIVALLILIISSINYINLTTAQSVKRLKEIGVRKILGASKNQIAKQFLGETFLLSSIACITAIVLVVFLLPFYEELLGEDLRITNIDLLQSALSLLIIIVLISILSGSYLAFYLSSFNIKETFSASLPKSSLFNFKKGLIIVQFVITIGLIASTLFISQQLKYTKTKNLGLDKEHVLTLPLIGLNAQNSYALLKQKLLGFPEIKSVSGVSEVPYNGITQNGFMPEGSTNVIFIHQLDADESFLETFGIELLSGSFFSESKKTLKDGYVINETLAKMLGWEDPIGKTIERSGHHKIIGVVADFHFASLYDKIEPLIITNKPWGNHYASLAIKYHAEQTLAITDKTQKLWNEVLPGNPFDYVFLDSAFDAIYKSEKRFQQVFFYFSVLSIILSLSGIFGLVLLVLKQRTKELGIRKVLGADIKDIVKLTTEDFIKLILIAAIISTPITWYFMHKWLNNFAYHIEIEWWIFLVASMAIIIIAMLTISIQTIKAAMMHPVESLKTE